MIWLYNVRVAVSGIGPKSASLHESVQLCTALSCALPPKAFKHEGLGLTPRAIHPIWGRALTGKLWDSVQMCSILARNKEQLGEAFSKTAAFWKRWDAKNKNHQFRYQLGKDLEQLSGNCYDAYG